MVKFDVEMNERSFEAYRAPVHGVSIGMGGPLPGKPGVA